MTSEFTVCSHCNVNNSPGRNICWSCGQALPVAVGADGCRVAVATGALNCSNAEIQALLNQSVTLDVENESRKLRADMLDAGIASAAAPEPSPSRRIGLRMFSHLVRR